MFPYTKEAVKFLQQTPFLKGVEHAYLETVVAELTVQIYPAGTMIFTPDSPTDCAYILRKGRVQLYRITANGKRLVNWQMQQGTMYLRKLLVPGKDHNFAEALVESTVWLLNKEKVDDLLQKYPQIIREALLTSFNRIDSLEERFINLVYQPVRVRLAHFLLSNTDQDTGVLTHMTHEDIGINVGAVQQTVTEALNRMQDEQLIKIKPKQIKIIDRRGVENILGEIKVEDPDFS
jgi:CRP/FNR family transcriptional regulator, cyclic AMP receptor protein